MKKYTVADNGPRGCLPSSLFKYFDMRDIRSATDEFVSCMNDIATEFQEKIHAVNCRYSPGKIDLNPRKLFGQSVTLEYVGAGSYGSVYKITIADHTFALKIGRFPRNRTEELENMHLQKRARNLFNRTHIASPVTINGRQYVWFFMNYSAPCPYNVCQYLSVCERVFLVYLTKGLEYDDLSIMNVNGSRILDKGGLEISPVSLTRIEIDCVKKLVDSMRKYDLCTFTKHANHLSRKYPDVIKYMALNMSVADMWLRLRYKGFIQCIAELKKKNNLQK